MQSKQTVRKEQYTHFIEQYNHTHEFREIGMGEESFTIPLPIEYLQQTLEKTKTMEFRRTVAVFKIKYKTDK